MEQCSTQELIKSTRAFEERVRYWQKKGLTLHEAEARASRKSKPILAAARSGLPNRRRIQNPLKINPIRGFSSQNTSNFSEPTEEQVQEVLSKLFESGKATLVNAHGQVIEPEKFKNAAIKAKRNDSDQIKSVFKLLIPALQVLISSALLITMTVKALGGPSIEHFALALLLETGILSLFLTRSTSLWKNLAMRSGGCALIVLGFFLLHAPANADHNRQIIQTVSGDESVESIKLTKKKLESDLMALPPTHRTARNELLNEIDQKQAELEAAQSLAIKSGGVGALQQIFLTGVLIRLALQLLNVFFGHNFVVQLRREGFLT